MTKRGGILILEFDLQQGAEAARQVSPRGLVAQGVSCKGAEGRELLLVPSKVSKAEAVVVCCPRP